MERRPTVLVPAVYVGAGLDKGRRRSRVPELGGNVQRAFLVGDEGGLVDVGNGACLEKGPDDLFAAPSGRGVQLFFFA